MELYNGLKEIFQVICDYFLSLIDGLFQVVSALASISRISASASAWMPGALFSVFIVSVTLIVVLRIVGR